MSSDHVATISPATLRPLRREDQVVEREIDGSLVLYDHGHQRVHVLNPTASMIWQMCDGNHAAEEIAAQLAAMFPSHADAIPDDVASVLRMFAVERLLVA